MAEPGNESGTVFKDVDTGNFNEFLRILDEILQHEAPPDNGADTETEIESSKDMPDVNSGGIMESVHRLKSLMLIKEERNHNGFERGSEYWVYAKDGDYIGEVANTEGDDSDMWNNANDVYDLEATNSFTKFMRENNLVADEIGRIKRNRIAMVDGRPLSKGYYAPSQSEVWYDEKTDTWYNLSGSTLRNPREYDRTNPEWTPFGDEGDNYENY